MVVYTEIQLFQILGWVVAVAFSYKFRELAKGASTAWTWIFIGTTLILIRTVWDLIPGIGDNIQGAVLGHILGMIAIMVLLKGFLDYYVNTKVMVG